MSVSRSRRNPRLLAISEILPDPAHPVGEVMRVLGRDFDYLAGKMTPSAQRGTFTQKDATHARSLMRALFALVEGVTHALKVTAMGYHLVQDKSSARTGVGEVVFEERYELGDKGEIVTKPMKITLDRNVKFAFRFYAETYSVENPLKTDAQWWHALKRCEKLRDRLMHPRRPEDLQLKTNDVVDALAAEHGFKETVTDLVSGGTVQVLGKTGRT
jgi:hypothetical protein